MGRIFQSLKNLPTPSGLAVMRAADTIADHRAHLAEIAAMEASGESRAVTDADRARVQERMTTLGALLKGRHRAAVLPLVLEAFPDLAELGKDEDGKEEATPTA